MGAIAVFASLVYFAIQIRQNNRNVETTLQTMRLGATDSTVSGFARYRELLSRKELAELFVKGSQDYDCLTKSDQIRFGVVLEEYMFTYWALYKRVQENAYEQSDWLAHMNSLRANMDNPGIKNWWLQRKKMFPSNFVEEIEKQTNISHGDA